MNPRRQPWQGCTLPLSYSRSTGAQIVAEPGGPCQVSFRRAGGRTAGGAPRETGPPCAPMRPGRGEDAGRAPVVPGGLPHPRRDPKGAGRRRGSLPGQTPPRVGRKKDGPFPASVGCLARLTPKKGLTFDPVRSTIASEQQALLACCVSVRMLLRAVSDGIFWFTRNEADSGKRLVR